MNTGLTNSYEMFDFLVFSPDFPIELVRHLSNVSLTI